MKSTIFIHYLLAFVRFFDFIAYIKTTTTTTTTTTHKQTAVD